MILRQSKEIERVLSSSQSKWIADGIDPLAALRSVPLNSLGILHPKMLLELSIASITSLSQRSIIESLISDRSSFLVGGLVSKAASRYPCG